MTRPVGSGRRDRRVTLLSPTFPIKADGDGKPAFVEAGKAWASRDDVGGREFVSSARELSDRMTRMILPYRDDVTTAWRVRDGAAEWEIVALSEVGRRQQLELTCSKVGA